MGLGARWPDRLMLTALAALVISPALAFGGVYRPVFTALEAGSLALLAVCLSSLLRDKSVPGPFASWRFSGAAMLAIALAAWLGLQIVPLPPSLLRALSPATFRLYRIALPGWPRTGALLSAHAPSISVAALTASAARWRTISISPSATFSSLIEGLALAAFLAVLVLYPFGLIGERDAQRRCYTRTFALIVMANGAFLAILGLVQRAWWNGKLLWLMTPFDWGGPLVEHIPRASGPFVDPDHFANYLAMLLPLTLIAALYPGALVEKKHHADLRLAAALAALLLGFALLLSLSRGGITAALIGTSFALGLCYWRTRPPIANLSRVQRWSFAGLVSVAIVAITALAIWTLGAGGRDFAAQRLAAAKTSGDWHYRLSAWADSLPMIRDFPRFGVGLGAWPELFPHYRRAPWMPFFFRQAENDYVQFTAETGLVGLLLAAALGLIVARRLRRGGATLGVRDWPLYSALLGGLVAMLVHEACDFSFHTPANAWLAVVLLGLSMRMTSATQKPPEVIRRAAPSRSPTFLPCLGIAAAIVMVPLVYLQDGAAYPYGRVEGSSSFASIVTKITRHPAMADGHIALAQSRRVAPNVGEAALRIAVWLDPNDPRARDLYARALLRRGAQAEGLAQIRESVYRAPEARAHYYLDPHLAPWLLPREQAAISGGLRAAVEADTPNALETLDGFDRIVGNYGELAAVYARRASAEPNPRRKAASLIAAGGNYLLAGDYADAATQLDEALVLDPQNADVYAPLAQLAYDRTRNLASAQSIIRRGLDAGAARNQLELALADLAARAEAPADEAAALESALRAQPAYATAMRLGNLDLANHWPVRAAAAFTRAGELDPGSAEAAFALGVAHEQAYDYTAADAAYTRAQRLAPHNAYYAQVRRQFARRVSTPLSGGAPE